MTHTNKKNKRVNEDVTSMYEQDLLRKGVMQLGRFPCEMCLDGKGTVGKGKVNEKKTQRKKKKNSKKKTKTKAQTKTNNRRPQRRTRVREHM